MGRVRRGLQWAVRRVLRPIAGRVAKHVRRPPVWVLLVPAAAAYGVALWKMPDWMHVTEPRDRHNARVLVVSIGGGLLVLTGLLYTARSYRLSHRGQVTDRFIKALERLGSDEMYVRYGGVLALDQIVHDAPDQATHATEVLEAFVRTRSPLPPVTARTRVRGWVGRGMDGLPVHLPRLTQRMPWLLHMRKRKSGVAEDVQVALTSLTRPAARRAVSAGHTLRLAEVRLVGALLGYADLSGAVLSNSDLSDTWLVRANLSKADLSWANLSGAWLPGATLSRASLLKANLTAALLGRVDLTKANLIGADLTAARLHDADLTDARLDGTNMKKARGLTAAQVVAARPTSSTRLPVDIAADPEVQARIAVVEAEDANDAANLGLPF